MMLALSEWCTPRCRPSPRDSPECPGECGQGLLASTKAGSKLASQVQLSPESQYNEWLRRRLQAAGLEVYYDRLKALNLSMEELVNLKEEQLREAGVSSIGHRKQLMRHLTLATTPTSSLVRPKESLKAAVLDALSEFQLSPSFFIEQEELSLGEKVGEGSFGEVFRGRWLGQPVAVKVTHAHISLEACLREAGTMLKTVCPYFVLCMGVTITEGGRVALVTEFLELGSLYHQLHRVKRAFAPAEKARIA
jgi:hypothetical protein